MRAYPSSAVVMDILPSGIRLFYPEGKQLISDMRQETARIIHRQIYKNKEAEIQFPHTNNS